MQTMTTSFVVRPVDSDHSLAQACLVRALCYGHHVPALREAFAEPDPLDESASCTNFVALDKATGAPVGALRVQIGHRDKPLLLEASFELPAALAGQTRAELTRLSVLPKADPLVRPLLWKAGVYCCLANQVQCMVIGARLPALMRQYKGLGFTTLTDEPVTFAHAGGLPHHVLHLDVRSLERRWLDENPRMHELMFTTYHPDLDVIGWRWRPTPRTQPSAFQHSSSAGAMPPPSQRVSVE